jgi:hypothetical protein
MGQIAHSNVGYTPWFFKDFRITCKQKFNAIYKQYKNDKIANGISGNDRHECPSYDALNSWWHQSGNVMKHVNASANEIDEIVGSPKFQTNFNSGSKDDVSKEPLDRLIILDEVTKQNKRQKINVFEHFSTMAENNTMMLQQFLETNALFKNMDV